MYSVLKRFFCLLFLVSCTLSWGQKRIYVTLDISGSMNNQKYEYANYGAQMLQVLNQNNEVFLIVGAREGKMRGKNAYKKIQKSIYRIKSGRKTEIEDVKIFNEIFNAKKKNQELFLIGDGDWRGNTQTTQKELLDHFSSGNLRITFLQILNSKYITTSYEQFLNHHNLAKIYKTDDDASLTQNINTIAQEITGVSSLSKKEIFHQDNCLRFVPNVNLKKFIVLYQDAVKVSQLPKVNNVEINNKEVSTDLLGSPSTEKFVKHGGLISSNVYEINKNIAGGTAVTICFNQDIDVNKVKIFPITNIELSNFNVELITGGVKQLNENTIGVCRDNDQAIVKIAFSDDKEKVIDGSIKNTKVTVISNGKKYIAKYNKGEFVATIPLVGNETTYRVESELKGYFRRNSGEKKIVKISDCIKGKMPIKRAAEKIGSITLKQLRSQDEIIVQLTDNKTKELLNPRTFDIKVDNNYSHLFKDVKVAYNAKEEIVLTIEPKGFWCDCFIPDELTIDFRATPKKKKNFNGETYYPVEVPLKLSIVKQQSLFARCKWLLLSILGALFLGWFFIKLSKKRRFKKGSKIVFKSPSVQTMRSLNKTYIQSDFKLREKGFVAWLNRWLNPFTPEKRTLTFHKAGSANFNFTATQSFRRIEFPKSNFKKEKMSFYNYDEDSRDKYVKFDENNEITVKSTNRGFGTIEHYLLYTYPKKGWNDIASYRWFLRFLIFILFSYAIVALFLIINTIFNFI